MKVVEGLFGGIEPGSRNSRMSTLCHALVQAT
jgi:hypothetical protein